LTCKIVKICPRPAEFSLRFFKSDRLLGTITGRIKLAMIAVQNWLETEQLQICLIMQVQDKLMLEIGLGVVVNWVAAH
jgi:DNA polymerase I-like protein with 3'-5' exonuclease and polymerase domains